MRHSSASDRRATGDDQCERADDGVVRRALRRSLFVLVAVAVVVVAGAVVDLVRIRSDLDAGRNALDHLDLDTVRDVGLEGALDGAADHLATAHHRAETSPFLAALRPLPFVDDQIGAIRDLSAARRRPRP